MTRRRSTAALAREHCKIDQFSLNVRLTNYKKIAKKIELAISHVDRSEQIWNLTTRTTFRCRTRIHQRNTTIHLILQRKKHSLFSMYFQYKHNTKSQNFRKFSRYRTYWSGWSWNLAHLEISLRWNRKHQLEVQSSPPASKILKWTPRREVFVAATITKHTPTTIETTSTVRIKVQNQVLPVQRTGQPPRCARLLERQNR